MGLMRDGWRRNAVAYAPLLIWIGIIFFLSSGQGSMSQTSRIIRPLLQFLFPNDPEATLIIYHGYIRKLAHVIEYAVLGMLAGRAFLTSRHAAIAGFWFVWAAVLVLIVASIDEFNQSFNSARTGSGWDVLLDVGGGFSAIILLALFLRSTPRSS